MNLFNSRSWQARRREYYHQQESGTEQRRRKHAEMTDARLVEYGASLIKSYWRSTNDRDKNHAEVELAEVDEECRSRGKPELQGKIRALYLNWQRALNQINKFGPKEAAPDNAAGTPGGGAKAPDQEHEHGD